MSNYQLFFVAIIVLASNSAIAQGLVITDDRGERETKTCRSETTLFFAASLAASLTPYRSVSKMRGGEKVTFETSDGVKLSGIRLRAEASADTYLLILQGNGFPAGRVIQSFEPVRDEGIDVYAYDYRGYKGSGGKRRFWAMLQDYAEIIAQLNSEYSNHMIYATSFGGVIATNVITDYSAYDLVFLDSVIAKASYVIECEREYDPADVLPAHCSSAVVQENGRDRFYTKGLLDALTSAVESCGGKSMLQPNLAHPFEEDDDSITVRMGRIIQVIRSSR